MNKKDYIEQIITENLDGLNNLQPPEGHLERFQERLKNEPGVRIFRWNPLWKVAAAVVFIILIINTILSQFGKRTYYEPAVRFLK